MVDHWPHIVHVGAGGVRTVGNVVNELKPQIGWLQWVETWLLGAEWDGAQEEMPGFTGRRSCLLKPCWERGS